MPITRYLALLAAVLALAGATILLAALVAPKLGGATQGWVGVMLLVASAVGFLIARRPR